MPMQPTPKHTRVVFLPGDAPPQGHDTMTKASLAASLADFLGAEYGGSCDALARGEAVQAYAVPCETLTRAQAQRLGIRDADDLFGGVAPLPFMATKSITHPLVARDAQAPEGWVPQFPDRVTDEVLEGFSTFDACDARWACSRLLHGGTVRLKDASGVGGSGQAVVSNLQQFDALLESEAFASPWRDGLVLERNLNHVQTVSVGQVRVGDWVLSYHGRQRLTRNPCGKEVYGGSSLHLVRGDFEVLLDAEMPAALRLAVNQARTYHLAALSSFDGLFASRSNYDVVQGFDDGGVWRSGVLEQSWRIGGASGAEIAALHVFRRHPGLRWVEASTHEVYAATAALPAGAQRHYDGRVAPAGRLLKYATVDAHGND